MAKGVRAFLILLVPAGIFAACSGGGNTPSVTPVNPTTASGDFAPSAASADLHKAERRRIALDNIGKSLRLPSVAGMTERITLPANDAQLGATLEVTVSKVLPHTVSRLPARDSKAFMSFSLEASADVTLRGIPRFSVSLRSNPSNHGAFYAWAFSPQSGWRDFGPMTVSGNVLRFGGSLKSLRLKRGVAYAVIPFTAVASEGCPGPNLFVANSQNATVTEYAPPYTGAPIATISFNVFTSIPVGVAFDPSGHLFVADVRMGTVSEFASPYTGAPIATITNGLNGPFGLAFDASGNLFVANSGGPTVTEYAPPYTGAPIATISNGLTSPVGVAFDASGNLFVSNSDLHNNNIIEYAPPYTGAPVSTISNNLNGPLGLAFNTSGNLFVVNFQNDNVTEYASPYTGAPVATISGGVISFPSALAFDANGNLFVANQYSYPGEINEFTPPYTGAPIATFSNSLSAPKGLAFGP